MPYPEYTRENVAFFIGSMMPLCLVLSFAIIIPPLMKRIVHEKESGIKASTILYVFWQHPHIVTIKMGFSIKL